MIVWRISNHKQLDGGGGLRAPGRWHSKGKRIVYCAPDPAAALLEVLVHLEIDTEDIPVKLQYLEILIPDSVRVERLAAGSLRKGWEKQVAITRAYGDKWLKEGRTAVLQVPSVVVPETWNVLINPVHADAEGIRVQRMFRQSLDTRLGRGD